ncbi:hypothetical protein O181_011646 [Austropuccinia psidii MF-1]|uniref:Ubiquitin-like domain-containing protein n=1 Tax=Austropuccinia psidii MF-1 TaxID=1389203 RepID=A0A9Q3BT58_9BASI|nr:hypothetical protein [Austropuccinia psidii MF-1]
MSQSSSINDQIDLQNSNKSTINQTNNLSINNPIKLQSIENYPEINHNLQLDSTNSLLISLLKPSTIEFFQSGQNHQILKIHSSKTLVQDVKTWISKNWSGKPKLDGIRLIANGRILNDNESIGQTSKNHSDPTFAQPIHVVIRPGAWTEKLPLSLNHQRPSSAPPTTTTTTTLNQLNNSSPLTLKNQKSINPIPQSNQSSTQLPSASSLPQLQSSPQPQLDSINSTSNDNLIPPTVSNSPFHLLINHLSSISSEQRDSFIENLLKAQFLLIERLESLRHQLAQNQSLLINIDFNQISLKNDQAHKLQLESWKLVEEKLIKLLTDLKYWGHHSDLNPSDLTQQLSSNLKDLGNDQSNQFERLEIGGLPFLLCIPKESQIKLFETNLSENSNNLTSLKPHLLTHLKLKTELKRILYLESRLNLLLSQTKKLQTHFNHLELVFSTSPFNLFFNRPGHNHHLSNSATSSIRAQNILNAPNLAPGQPPLPGLGAANGLGAGVGPAVGAGAGAVAGGGVAGFGFGLGIGDGLFPFPNNFPRPNGQLWQQQIPRVRRYEFTINLDSIRRYMAPLFWLSLKLSILLYIFGRHASYSKLVILISIAAIWVLWEAFSINRRHDAQVRRRDRLQRFQAGGAGAPDPVQAVLDRGRRRAERERLQRLRDQRQRQEPLPPQNLENRQGNNQPGLRPVQQNPLVERPAQNPMVNPVPPAIVRPNNRRDLRTAVAEIRARGGAFPPGTEVRPFRTTSAFSPKYWFNSIAVVGLASEYRELGLHPIGEQALGSSNSEYPRWYKYMRNIKTCVILFFGTLIPEIEKKRKKALEKRLRILNMVIADTARYRENENNQARNLESPSASIVTTARHEIQLAGRDSSKENRATSESSTKSQLIDSQSTPKKASTSAVDLMTPRSTDATIFMRKSNQDSIERTTGQAVEPNVMESEGIKSTSLRGSMKPNESKTAPDLSIGSSNDSSNNSNVIVDQKLGNSDSHQSKIGTPTMINLPIGSTSNQGAGDNTQLNQENHLNDGLDSPLTPLNERHVVGGFDDTDDDDELINGVDDEAGMVLF